MPRIRKVSAAEGANWIDEAVPMPCEKCGITRMDYPQHGSVGWIARVYAAGQTFSHYFADEVHGGPEAALRLAEEWRDAKRKSLPPPQPTTPTIRIVRVEKPQQKLVGWYVYVSAAGKRQRRYVSDVAYGGRMRARKVGEKWAQEQIEGMAHAGDRVTM